MKEGEKPGKFLLPHGIILLEFGPYRIFMEGNPEGIQNQRPLGIMELSVEVSSLFVTRVLAALSIPRRYAGEGASISIKGMRPTASSACCAPAFGSGSCLT